MAAATGTACVRFPSDSPADALFHLKSSANRVGDDGTHRPAIRPDGVVESAAALETLGPERVLLLAGYPCTKYTLCN